MTTTRTSLVNITLCDCRLLLHQTMKLVALKLSTPSYELAELPAKACIPNESEQNHQTKDLVSVTGIP